MLIEMHAHTIEGSSCSEVSLEQTVTRLKEKGFDGVLITDHESESGYRNYCSKHSCLSDFIVLRGFEVSTRYGDMLVVLPLTETVLDITEVTEQCIHPLELVRVVHERDGVIGIAHMFRERYGCIGNQVKSMDKLEMIVKAVDFIEVVNGDASQQANDMAEIWANRFMKAKTCGSDSHTVEAIGICGTVFSVPIRSEEDLIRAIRDKSIINA